MITATLNGDDMPPIEREFIDSPVENAVDVVTLSGDIYTDFISIENSWTFNYATLTQEQYDELRAKYDTQFSTYQYPTLSIPYYEVEDQPVRMYINDKNIWDNCGSVAGVQIIFRLTSQLPEVS